MKKLLVTGGSGLIGGHVASKASGVWEVYATCRSNPVDLSSVQSILLRLKDNDSILEVIRQIRPDVVIHCAAWSDLDRCEQDRKHAFQINAEGTAVLAKVCAESNIRLIFTSSDMVFDGKKGNYTESDNPRPINVYGETKLFAEENIRSVCSNYVIVRVALVYGKPAICGNSFSEKIVIQLRQGKSVPLFTDQFRTPVWVQTLADALVKLAGHDYVGTLHIGGSEKVDRYTFGLVLAEIGQYPSELCRPVSMFDLPTVAPRPQDTSFNISLAKKMLKIPFTSYRKGLSFDYSVEENEIS
jgi:dTDP-4-dehydrorhamnose reductase